MINYRNLENINNINKLLIKLLINSNRLNPSNKCPIISCLPLNSILQITSCLVLLFIFNLFVFSLNQI